MHWTCMISFLCVNDMTFDQYKRVNCPYASYFSLLCEDKSPGCAIPSLIFHYQCVCSRVCI